MSWGINGSVGCGGQYISAKEVIRGTQDKTQIFGRLQSNGKKSLKAFLPVVFEIALIS
jgi:hypothetical protein